MQGKKSAPRKALYRTHRSKSLSEVVGQKHITDILSRAIKQGKIAHAYLFTGPRGVGKTSVARILAHEINQLPYDETTLHPDIVEIDAASNRRIDDIRELRDKVQIAPSSAKYKVYIIDEVHMLTGESFNAFLKTLEEPPQHVVFILATTDAHKLPVTITSRTQRFTFRAITQNDAITHLKSIAEKEKISIEDDALELVVQHGDGSFRDSISLLDQLSSLSEKSTPISRQLVEDVLGMAKKDRIDTLLKAYTGHDQEAIITMLNELEKEGITPQVVANQLIQEVKNQLAKAPTLVYLLDSLIEVSKSPRPDAKLLVSLLTYDTPSLPKQKVAAASVATPPELKALEKEATKLRPSEKKTRPTPQKDITDDTAQSTHSNEAESPAEVVSPKVYAKTGGEPIDFDWDGYVAYVREKAIAVASILNKCKGEFDGETLTIYAGTAFWKRKLDDAKYQPTLHEGLMPLGLSGILIETIPAAAPPKDSQAAAVAAIMGGGEEVSLENS